VSDPFDLAQAVEPVSAGAAPGGTVAVPPYFAGLNEAQAEAVAITEGPLLVLAGAGTGKTRVLTTRLAHILRSRLAWPSQMLAVTFTNKAAREMRERVGALIGAAVEGLWLGTFHSNAVRILRRHADLVGLKSDFSILDVDDQLRVMKQVIEDANIDEKRWPARALATLIDRWKDKGLRPDMLDRDEAAGFAQGRGGALYAAYQERLRTLNATDFGDLLLHTLTLFTSRTDVLAEYQERFRYILVDEYQDTNVAQYLWLRLLAQRHRNLCCVGDDDQSIYGWRGAEVGNILRFEQDFPGARVVRLERNYRSTPHILGSASKLIAHNQGRLGKTLWTDDADPGEKIVIRGVWDGDEEARLVGEDIEALQRAGHRLNAIAILVRASFQTREFEDRFLTIGIPYRIVGGLGFYARREIRDIIAYLRVIHQPDDDLAFERIINVPKRGIGEATLQAMHQLARHERRSLYRVAGTLLATDELRPQVRRVLGELQASFERWRAAAAQTALPVLIATVLAESGYAEMWQLARTVDAPGRLENLKELLSATETFETLTAFLDHVSLVMDNDAQAGGDAVNLLTLHSAKGLEFDTVFLPGWEEGLFPNQRTLDEGGLAALEEERRLAYVGLTRARQRVRISYAANRRVYATWQAALPSRFIAELPPEHAEHAAEHGMYGRTVRGLEDGAAATPSPGPSSFGRRFGNRIASGGAVAGGERLSGEIDLTPAGEFRTGMRVFHQKFGYGAVLAVEGNRLDIAFEKAGRKKVVDSFVAPV